MQRPPEQSARIPSLRPTLDIYLCERKHSHFHAERSCFETPEKSCWSICPSWSRAVIVNGNRPRHAAIGVDFGTLSGRALVVRVEDGAELGAAVHPYAHGVVDAALPETGRRCRRTGRCRSRPTTSTSSGRPSRRRSRPAAFTPTTSSRSAPTSRRARCFPPSPTERRCASWPSSPTGRTPTPNCGATMPPRRTPTASTPLAAERGEPWLARYGFKISSEWEFAKALQVLEEDPDVYARTEHWIEAADWIVWQLTGRYVRNVCTAGYKAIRQDGHYPSAEFLAALNPAFARFRPRQGRGADRPTRRTRRRAVGAGRGVDRPAAGHRRVRRQRRRARHGARRAGDQPGPDACRDGHVDLPHHELDATGPGARHVRRRGGRW